MSQRWNGGTKPDPIIVEIIVSKTDKADSRKISCGAGILQLGDLSGNCAPHDFPYDSWNSTESNA